MKTGKLWDIFCQVIDNYGDVGVCWRLAADLATRGERVRLWLDDRSALSWMCPQGVSGVEVRDWTPTLQTEQLPMSDVLLEAFGCQVAPELIAAYASWTGARGLKGLWINLEYLSAESFTERSHGLPSPVMSGPGAGLTKHFFYPGFTAATGGLLREPDLLARQAAFDRSRWLAQIGVPHRGERLVSLFCYEPQALSDLLERLANDAQPTQLLVTAGRSTAAVQTCVARKNAAQPLWNANGALRLTYLPMLSQHDFDHLLWSCDLNFVRGEDSLVRALWANKPFVWQIYPQHDDAHQAKLAAFLDLLAAPSTLRDFFEVWNGIRAAPLPALDLALWQKTVSSARSRQLGERDLVTQLISWASKNH